MSLSGGLNLGGTNNVRTVQLSDKDAKAIQEAAAAKGLKLVNIGVVVLPPDEARSEEHTSELQVRQYLVCRLLLDKKKQKTTTSMAAERLNHNNKDASDAHSN